MTVVVMLGNVIEIIIGVIRPHYSADRIPLILSTHIVDVADIDIIFVLAESVPADKFYGGGNNDRVQKLGICDSVVINTGRSVLDSIVEAV